MYHYDYVTSGTCSQVISIDLENDLIKNVSFMGGCNGNLKAIPLLIKDKKVEEIASLLSGLTCGNRKTSCGDQLAIALREAYASELTGKPQEV